MKKNFLFKGVSVLGVMLLLATSVMPGLQYAVAESYPTDAPIWDYVHDVTSWNEAYNKENSALKAYEDINRTEDLYSNESHRVAQITDMICSFTSYADESGNIEYAYGTIKGILYGPYVYPTPADYNEVEVVTNSIDGFIGRHFYLKDDAFDINEIKEGSDDLYELFVNKDPWTSAEVWVKINSCYYPEEFEKSWNAWSPKWAVVNLPIPFKGTISVQYDGGDVTYPWGSDARLFTAGYAIKGVASYADFNPEKLDITLIPAYTVTFDINGGESTVEIENQDVLKGETATKPTDPTKEGYVFLGWFEENATSPYDFTTPVTADVDLTAEWVLESNVVTFVTSNDNPLPVVFDKDNNNTIDLKSTKALFNKLSAPDPSDTESIAILNYILTTNSTEGVAEIKQVGDEYVLFFNVNAVMPSVQQTKAFRQEESVLFNANSFKNNDTNTDVTVISYDLSKAIAPDWVNKDDVIKSYNEVKDGDVIIGYTFHTNTKYGWFYAPAKYNVTFVDVDGTTELKEATAYAYGTIAAEITLPENLPTKAADSTCNTYELGWTPALADVTGNATYKAKFTCTSKKSSSYLGGGGSSSSKKSETTKEDTKANTGDTAKLDDTKANENANEENKNEGSNTDGATATPEEFSQEFKDAYEFAHKNGITTKESIEDADMYGPLTRIAMAKMLSQYAINVLGQKPDTDKVVPNFPDVDAQLDADYNNGVTLAYQLGIMGIGIEEFRPFAEVTRAEFGTALSRMLFGTADGEGDNWYKTHLDKLMNDKIITNDDPNLKELRGYVMIMLMRSASDK